MLNVTPNCLSVTHLAATSFTRDDVTNFRQMLQQIFIIFLHFVSLVWTLEIIQPSTKTSNII